MLFSLILFISTILFTDSLQNKVEKFQNSLQMKHSTVVASVWNNTKKEQVVGFNTEKWINPASTLKLVTTATAFSLLDRKQPFTTSFQLSGSILNDELVGDIIVYPSGDPTFGSPRWPSKNVYKEICDALLARGIRRISGQIRLSVIHSPEIPDGWIWGDIGNYYGAVPHFFNYAENSFTTYFEGAKQVGKPAKISGFSRNLLDYQVHNEVITGMQDSGDQVMIYSSPLSQTIWLKGTVPAGSSRFPVKGTLPNPWKTFCTELAESFKRYSIFFTETETPDYSPETQLIQFPSPTLSEIVTLCNQESINLYADGLLKASFSDKNAYATFLESTEKLRTYWEKQGADWSGFRMEDGSGLSSQNLVQAGSYSQFLGQLTNTAYFQDFLKTLPQMGVSGTVKNLPKSKRPVYVKSGTINGVKTYAGFVKNEAGEWLTFFVGVDRYTSNEAKEVRKFLVNFLVELGE